MKSLQAWKIYTGLMLVIGVGSLLFLALERNATHSRSITSDFIVGHNLSSVMVRDSSQAIPATLSLLGRPHLVYVFSTSCAICSEQKGRVEEFLADINRQVNVVSLSIEEPQLVASYWGVESSRLSRPHSTYPFALSQLGVTSVPTMLLTNRSGQIEWAYIGPLNRLDRLQLKNSLGKILSEQ